LKNSNLKNLLSQYSEKRNFEIARAREKKKDLYEKNPRLQEIDDELSSYALSTAKAILQTNNKSLLDDLNTKKNSLLKEKDEIYKSLNIDSTYFNPQFECNMCKDTGYITENYKTEMCNCLKQKLFDLEYNQSNTFDIKNISLDKFSLEQYSPVANSEKYGSKISPRQNIELIYKISTNFINNFDNAKEKNLLFTGNPGLGKTFLSSCIANELLKKKKTVLYQTAPVMLDSIINCRMRKINKLWLNKEFIFCRLACYWWFRNRKHE